MKLLTTGLAGAGVLLAVVAIFLALQARGTAAPAAADPSVGLREEIDRLREDVRTLRHQLAGGSGRTGERARVKTHDAESESRTAPAEETKSPTRELLSLGRKVIAGSATQEEAGRFWELAREKGRIDDLLDLLTGEVQASPRDVEARLRLADACVLKLFTVPPGPEMALWGGKACDEWREVLEIEPDHWKARFSIAVSLSYHPDVAGKTPEAIRELERLVAQQESMTPEPRHADVYRLLATLYRRQGDGEAAERTLRLGLSRHPDDEKLRKAVEAITR